MKILIISTLCLSLLALTACKKNPPREVSTEKSEEELKKWQIRAQDELEKRELAEAEKLTSISRAKSLEKVVIVTGIAAIGFLFIGGAMGSKAKNDAQHS